MGGTLGGGLGGMLDDPNTVSMLGLAAGIANAARPSRLPVPFGAAMAEGFGSAMQFRNQALQNQRAQAQTALLQQQGILEAIQARLGMQRYGLLDKMSQQPGPLDLLGGQPQGPLQGGSPQATPTAQPSGYSFDNNVGNLRVSPAAWEGKGPPGGPGNGFETFATPEQGARAAGLNLVTQADKISRLTGQPATLRQIINQWAPASDNNNPEAYTAAVSKATGLNPDAPFPTNDPNAIQTVVRAIANVEKGPRNVLTAQAGQPGQFPGLPANRAADVGVVRRLVSTGDATGATASDFEAAAAEMTRQSQIWALGGIPNKALEDRAKYFTDQAQALRASQRAPAEEAAKAQAVVAPHIAEARGKAEAEAELKTVDTAVTTPTGDKVVPLTEKQRVDMALGRMPGMTFAGKPTPENQAFIADQTKTMATPAANAIEASRNTRAALLQMMELGKNLRTGKLAEHIGDINNYLASVFGPNSGPRIDPAHFDENTAAALIKNANQIVVDQIQNTLSSGSGVSSRGNMLIMRLIERAKPGIEMPGPALASVAQNMIDMLDIATERNKTLLHDFQKNVSNKQPLPFDWEANYWDQYDKVHPGWDKALAEKVAKGARSGAASSVADPVGLR